MDVDNSVTTTGVSNEIIAPSHRIPPEIVVEIIHELLPTTTKIDYNPQMGWRLKVLLTATSICRYWRYAAIGHATLWSIVPMSRIGLRGLFLKRSCDMPLLVTFEGKTREFRPAYQAMVLLLPHMQRVEKIHFRASGAVLNEAFSTLNRFARGGQLKEISVRVDGPPGSESYKFNLDLLLEHASSLKVLRVCVPGSQLDHKFRQLSHLTHLELMTSHSIRDIISLLISLPALTSTKVGVNAGATGADNHRTLLPANLRYIHLRITCVAANRVLDAMKTAAGVHLECESLVALFCVRFDDQARRFILAPEFFENTSHIEELRISLSLCSGSGPNGSFCIKGITIAGFQLPIEDFSLLRKLVVDGTVDQQTLEGVVRSAPRLVSVVFINCSVVRSRAADRTPKTLPSPVDMDVFVNTISKGSGVGKNAAVSKTIVLDGTLEGEHLGEFRSLLENWKQAGEHSDIS
jgi:hypothetical protein